MKKIIAFALLLTLIIGFGTCGAESNDVDSNIMYAMIKLPNGEVVTGKCTECMLYNYSDICIVFDPCVNGFTDMGA